MNGNKLVHMSVPFKAIGNRQLSIGNGQWAMGNWQWAMSNEQSIIFKKMELILVGASDLDI